MADRSATRFLNFNNMGFRMTRATLSRTNDSTLPETSDETEAWPSIAGKGSFI
jgi:hypothetical protein